MCAPGGGGERMRWERTAGVHPAPGGVAGGGGRRATARAADGRGQVKAAARAACAGTAPPTGPRIRRASERDAGIPSAEKGRAERAPSSRSPGVNVGCRCSARRDSSRARFMSRRRSLRSSLSGTAIATDGAGGVEEGRRPRRGHKYRAGAAHGVRGAGRQRSGSVGDGGPVGGGPWSPWSLAARCALPCRRCANCAPGPPRRGWRRAQASAPMPPAAVRPCFIILSNPRTNPRRRGPAQPHARAGAGEPRRPRAFCPLCGAQTWLAKLGLGRLAVGFGRLT